ncbi:hypothetical protein AWC11_23160 [Mycobacterium interjectum]|nr:hypothetical protein AWC11_23160 [Mycobacterium interjectum]
MTTQTAADGAYKTVATQPKQPGVDAWLRALAPEIERALPKGMDADRIARLVFTEVRKSQRAKAAGIAISSLDECTKESFAGALLTSSALGLEPGVNGECYLIPFKDNKSRTVECQLVVGYQGIVKLFWQHPRAEFIDAQAVYERDEFRYAKGLNPVLEHVPFAGDPDERGEVVAYYAVAKARGAAALWDVFTPKQIGRLRNGKVGPSGKIADPQRWMERKTALKQVLKLAPKTTRLDMALRADENTGSELNHTIVPAITSAPDYIDGEFDEQPSDEQPADTEN